MKKKVGMLLLICFSVLLMSSVAFSTTVSLYVDAAPNVYGSPDYAPWKDAAFAAVASDTFVNMPSSINTGNVGTTNFEIQDEVVYSFGDLGKRLTWMYWIGGETVSSLQNRIEVSLFNTWDGDVLDFYDYYYGSTWLVPTQIYDYDSDNDGDTDGVIGLAGMAWWGANGVNTQEALDADIASWINADETWDFTVKLDNSTYSIQSVRTAPVPEPATVILLGLGLLGITGLSRKKSK